MLLARMAVLAAVLAGLAGAPAAASGAGTGWSEPLAVNDGESTYTRSPQVVAADDGSVVVAWEEASRHAAQEVRKTRVRALVRTPDGVAHGPYTLVESIHECTLLVRGNARGDVAVTWGQPDGTVQVARRRAGSPTFDATETLPETSFAGLWWPTVAVGPRGDVALAAVQHRSNPYPSPPPAESQSVVGWYAPPGGAFGAKRRLTPWMQFAQTNAVLAMDRGGRATLLFAYNPSESQVANRYAGPPRVGAVRWVDGEEPGDLQWVRTAEGATEITCPVLGADAAGNAVALWHEVLNGCGANETLRVAQAPAGGAFGESRVLSGTSPSSRRVVLRVAEDGQVLIAFVEVSPWAPGAEWTPPVTKLVTGTAAGALSITQTLPAEAALPAVGSGGTALVALDRERLSERTAAGAFGAPADACVAADAVAVSPRAAAFVKEVGYTVWLTVRDATAGPSACPPEPEPEPDTPPAAAAPSPEATTGTVRAQDVPPRPEGEAAAQELRERLAGFDPAVGRLRATGRGLSRTISVRVLCPEACRVDGRVRAIHLGRTIGRAAGRARGAGEITLRVRLRLRSRRPATYRGVVRIRSASGAVVERRLR